MNSDDLSITEMYVDHRERPMIRIEVQWHTDDVDNVPEYLDVNANYDAALDVVYDVEVVTSNTVEQEYWPIVASWVESDKTVLQMARTRYGLSVESEDPS